MKSVARVYLDTAPLIYLLEGEEGLRRKSREAISEWVRGEAILLSSVLVLGETLITPIKNRNRALEAEYQTLLAALLAQPLIEINRDIAEQAAAYRARHGFRYLDALQLAAARNQECDTFFTKDRQLTRFTELDVVLVESVDV